LRVPSGIRFRHLSELCDKYTTQSGYHDLDAFYACFMTCDDCQGHVRIPDHFDTDVVGEINELAELRPKLMHSARQFDTLQEKYIHYQLQREELYGGIARLAFEKQEIMRLESAMIDTTGTPRESSITNRELWISPLFVRKPEYVADENNSQQ
jgi:hypothetical protein